MSKDILKKLIVSCDERNPKYIITSYDSKGLQEAIETAQVSEAELVQALRIDGRTIGELVKHHEQEDVICRGMGMGLDGRTASSEARDALIEARKARGAYIPLEDNMLFSIGGDNPEKLVGDYFNWLKTVEFFSAHSLESISLDAIEKKFLDGAEEAYASGTVSLEYPNLHHGFSTDIFRKGEGAIRKFNHIWYCHGRDIPGKALVEVDLLSALRVANQFKDKGYQIKLHIGRKNGMVYAV